jgi:hypothetical protein
MNSYWYQKIYDCLLKDLGFSAYANVDFLNDPPYYKFQLLSPKDREVTSMRRMVFFDQEPFYFHLMGSYIKHMEDTDESRWLLNGPLADIMVTSEISNEIKSFCSTKGMKSVYYFFHALAASDWYRNYWKQDINVNIDHEYLFISYQHTVNTLRLHRVDFLCRLLDQGILDQGLISFKTPGIDKMSEFVHDAVWYTKESRALFDRYKEKIDKNLYIDTDNPTGVLSTTIDIENSQKAFLQVVTETSFSHNKLHLTEKIFKPIVAKQPFLLLASVGNLEYFKNYGFKTFSDYWDESYDKISDPGQRVQAVVKILKDLSLKSRHDLIEMKKDMIPILEHNWNHFYYDLKHIVASEFIDNIKIAFGKGVPVSDQKYQDFYKLITF